MSKRIIDEYTDRTDLSEKQKYCLRYPDKVSAQRKAWNENAKQNRDRENKRQREWRAKNPDTIARYNRNQRFKLYGISEDDYNNFLEKQDYKCAICKSKDPNHSDWCIDHCHTSGRVRGLLCLNCNTAIGSLKENIEVFKSAVLYLETGRLEELSESDIKRYEAGETAKVEAW